MRSSSPRSGARRWPSSPLSTGWRARPRRRGSRSSADAAASMRLTAIDHVQLAMPAGGEDRARGFYNAILGLPEKAKPPALAARGGVWFETPDLKIHLGVEKEFRPARKAHPALLVEDLPALADR